MNRSAVRGLCAGAALLLAAQGASAGGRLPCQEARVFSGAAVNALVLPYRYDAPARFDPRSASARLAALIQLETLMAMLKYGSVGATELVSEDGHLCDVGQVLKKVEDDGAGGLRHGHGLAVIWGRIYEERSEVYVQSYIRFLRRGEAETIEVAPARDGDAALGFAARLPARGVALAPRRFTQSDLAAIERRAAEALVLRRAPGDTGGGRPLAESPIEPLAYSVEKAEGEWMLIRSFFDQSKFGWVRARADDEAWALRRLLPELGYLDGVIGYLRLSVAKRAGPVPKPQRAYGWVRRAFADYEEAVGRDAALEAFGLARAMAGMLLWRDPALAGDGGRAQAAELFREAVQLMPASADARVLAAVTAPFVGPQPRLDRDALARIERGLLGAMAIDPRSALALANLERLYGFASRSPGLSAYTMEELQSRLATVSAARAGAAQR